MGKRKNENTFKYFFCFRGNISIDIHAGGVNPVQLNDIVFALHAVAATLFTIFQCFIFKVKMDSI